MDGNGRWARLRGKERVFGHAEGVESVRACLEAAAEAGVEYLSLYAFSEENWNRPEEEISALMDMMLKSMQKETPAFLENGIRVVVLGNRSRLSAKVNDAIDNVMEKTAPGKKTTLVVFLSYSGKWDILQAMKKAQAQLSDEDFQAMGEQDFAPYLSTSGIPDPDLLIRTSGELRISNYMLWQTAYTEFYFTDILWPDFRKDAFREALSAYALRERRYGKVK